MDSSNSLPGLRFAHFRCVLRVFSTDFGDRKIKEVSHKSHTSDFDHHDSTWTKKGCIYRTTQDMTNQCCIYLGFRDDSWRSTQSPDWMMVSGLPDIYCTYPDRSQRICMFLFLPDLLCFDSGEVVASKSIRGNWYKCPNGATNPTPTAQHYSVAWRGIVCNVM